MLSDDDLKSQVYAFRLVISTQRGYWCWLRLKSI
jgi:hypothetical protein